MTDRTPAFMHIAELTAAYRDRALSPVEVAEAALARIGQIDQALHAFVSVQPELTRSQARAASDAFARGESGPLLGVPLSIKDVFDVAGSVTTFGSVVHRGQVALRDSGAVARLRAAGAVFTGKTNTAEFGQSATTDNRLGPATRNPWDLTRTPGGSSGGAAASVSAGLSTIALGADGGGSIRIPAAFTGLVGMKPTHGFCPDEGGLRAMSAFSCPGPLARSVADARVMLELLRARPLGAAEPPRELRIGWCPRPEGRPVDPPLARAVAAAGKTLEGLSHHVVPMDVPVAGWEAIFGPLVLAEEHRERGHLLGYAGGDLTTYEHRSLTAARRMRPEQVAAAYAELERYRRRLARAFERVHVLAMPTTAIAAFPLGRRPATIGGDPVDALWGPFPFTAPFNVAGTPALSLPCGFVDGLPVGLQLVAPRHADALLLDLGEQLEQALALPLHQLEGRYAS